MSGQPENLNKPIIAETFATSTVQDQGSRTGTHTHRTDWHSETGIARLADRHSKQCESLHRKCSERDLPAGARGLFSHQQCAREISPASIHCLLIRQSLKTKIKTLYSLYDTRYSLDGTPESSSIRATAFAVPFFTVCYRPSPSVSSSVQPCITSTASTK